ncbi:hypothetical protein HDU67_008344 [Dinochytrium kinnereticum]|nr:hypothetical protein HDU67_008344 [Dinochytrium kinnereticum]
MRWPKPYHRAVVHRKLTLLYKQSSVTLNSFSGEIPLELTLMNLTYLSLSSNLLTGQIPSILGRMRSLKVFLSSDNKLTGRIPKELGDLANLENLNIAFNSFIGDVPKELGRLTNLKTLALDSCGLSGELPLELGQLKNLEFIGVQENQLSGAIPLGVAELSKLKVADFSNNYFSGVIPKFVVDVDLRIENNCFKTEDLVNNPSGSLGLQRPQEECARFMTGLTSTSTSSRSSTSLPSISTPAANFNASTITIILTICFVFVVAVVGIALILHRRWKGNGLIVAPKSKHQKSATSPSSGDSLAPQSRLTSGTVINGRIDGGVSSLRSQVTFETTSNLSPGEIGDSSSAFNLHSDSKQLALYAADDDVAGGSLKILGQDLNGYDERANVTELALSETRVNRSSLSAESEIDTTDVDRIRQHTAISGTLLANEVNVRRRSNTLNELTAEQVSAWLLSVGLGGPLVDQLAAQGVDGSLLMNLTDENLTRIGVQSSMARTLVLAAVYELRGSGVSSAGDAPPEYS